MFFFNYILMMIMTLIRWSWWKIWPKWRGEESDSSTIIGAERFRQGMSPRMVRWALFLSPKIMWQNTLKLPAFLYVDYVFFSSSIELRFPDLVIHNMTPVRLCLELLSTYLLASYYYYYFCVCDKKEQIL